MSEILDIVVTATTGLRETRELESQKWKKSHLDLEASRLLVGLSDCFSHIF